MKLLNAPLIALVCCFAAGAQTRSANPAAPKAPAFVCPDPTAKKACSTYQEMARNHDEAVRDADAVCFYAGNNPSKSSPFQPTVDEFFLLMDGAKATTKSGIHPSIFVQRVLNGMGDRYLGYGPESIGASWPTSSVRSRNAAEVLFAFDDLGPSFRFAHVQYSGKCGNPDPNVCPPDSLTLWGYRFTEIRRSTGRFIEQVHSFGGFTGPSNESYNGQCIRLKPSKVW